MPQIPLLVRGCENYIDQSFNGRLILLFQVTASKLDVLAIHQTSFDRFRHHLRPRLAIRLPRSTLLRTGLIFLHIYSKKLGRICHK